MEEILKKWDSIDDEIWAKAIVMERNRRVAKVRTAGTCKQQAEMRFVSRENRRVANSKRQT